MEERWITALDYDGLYEVSNLGRIKCLSKNGAAEHIMKPSHTNSRYNRIELYRNNKAKSFRVDEIVLRSFWKVEERFIDIYHHSDDLDDALDNLSYSPSCESINGEVWKTIPMYPTYEVSTFGRVRNSKHHIMKTNVRSDGYEWIYIDYINNSLAKCSINVANAREYVLSKVLQCHTSNNGRSSDTLPIPAAY